MARILVAEDDMAVRDFVRRALEMDGHEVVPVHDGNDALVRLDCRQDRFDLLLADIHLPGIDGISLAKDLGRHTGRLPVILMSGTPCRRASARAQNLPILAVIAKPFTLEQIQTLIRVALGIEEMAEVQSA